MILPSQRKLWEELENVSLLKTVIYVAVTKTVTCIIVTEWIIYIAVTENNTCLIA